MRALILAVVVGCTSSSTTPPPDLQMNDLSVLLPLPRSQAELDAWLAPTAMARGGALLPESTFTSAQAPIGYEGLRAVAFRLDPCFGASCQPQLRVVFQPLAVTVDGTVIAQDAAVHAFYALTADELLEAVTDVAAARHDDVGDADLGPLAVHPTVVAEGLGGPLAQRFAAIIVAYAGAANLVRFTALEVEFPDLVATGDEFWELESFDVASGVATRKVIPTLPSAATTMSFQAGTGPLTARMSPMTTSQDDISTLVDFAQAMQATPGVRQLAFDAALRIENPNDNSPDTIDCASCHMAQPARQLVGEPLGMLAAGNPNAFVPDAAIPAADLAATTQLVGTEGILNVHAFSYRESEPMINQRVINETAANLAYVRAHL